MNDRQRIEASIIPSLVFKVVYGLSDLQTTDEEKETHSKIVSASLQAMAEPFLDILPERKAQLSRRLVREQNSLFAIMHNASNKQCLMAIYYLLEGLLQKGRLVIYEDSYFGEAMQLYLDSLEELFKEERLDKASQKMANKLLRKLRQSGYFK